MGTWYTFQNLSNETNPYNQETVMENTMYILDLAGTVIFAMTGALVAGRKQMDMFGVVVLGCVTALGGGSLRDILLGIHPVFWVSDMVYLFAAVGGAVGTFILMRYRKIPTLALMYADAIGLAVFTVIGFQKSFQVTHVYTIAVVMGMATGVMGGMFRDVLSGEIPLILRREIYASASIFGASVYTFLIFLEWHTLSVPLAMLTTLTIRIAALHWDLSLPHFRLVDETETSSQNEGG